MKTLFSKISKALSRKKSVKSDTFFSTWYNLTTFLNITFSRLYHDPETCQKNSWNLICFHHMTFWRFFFRHFADAAEFMDDAILKNGKVFINCVFGKSRSTTFVVVYLMLCHNWDALSALKHIRAKRPVQINSGFLLQLVDLDYKLKWEKIKWRLK